VTGRFGSWHNGGLYMLFCDGSVHFFGCGIDAALWNSLSTRHGGEAMPTIE
jgi:prepilin-type processing-associated H-X9-DG protein